MTESYAKKTVAQDTGRFPFFPLKKKEKEMIVSRLANFTSFVHCTSLQTEIFRCENYSKCCCMAVDSQNILSDLY